MVKPSRHMQVLLVLVMNIHNGHPHTHTCKYLRGRSRQTLTYYCTKVLVALYSLTSNFIVLMTAIFRDWNMGKQLQWNKQILQIMIAVYLSRPLVTWQCYYFNSTASNFYLLFLPNISWKITQLQYYFQLSVNKFYIIANLNYNWAYYCSLFPAHHK